MTGKTWAIVSRGRLYINAVTGLPYGYSSRRAARAALAVRLAMGSTVRAAVVRIGWKAWISSNKA